MNKIVGFISSVVVLTLAAQIPLYSQTSVPLHPETPSNIATPAPEYAQPSSLGSAAPDANQLVIGIGDLLETSIFGADYSCGTNEKAQQTPGCTVRVSGAGDITLPFIGRVKVAGLTVEQAQDLVAKRLVEGRFYKNPQVTILQKEYSTQGISVLGEVQKPGIYPLLGPHTLLEAISMAGGTTIKAGNDVTITHRGTPNDPEHVVLNKDAAATVPVRPGDVVAVSKAGIVYVVGDVKLPSGVVMESSGLTVLQAVAMAQGANSTASLDNAKLIRSTATGKEEIPIPLKKILSSKATDVELQPGDILFIPSSAAKSAGRRGLEAILQTATGVAVYRR
jgi:polysaccharide biosynthesis/export protein